MQINCKGRLLQLDKPIVMGILNLTPDSFFAGSRMYSTQHAIDRASRMIAEGAGIIDIGGYSTRPGATEVGQLEEMDRCLPAILAIAKALPDAVISVDTFRASVANEALKAGASIVNDVSAGENDPAIMDVVAKHKAPYIIMHNKGSFHNMESNPKYDDVVMEVILYLKNRLELCLEKGIKDIIIDPGFGFGKKLEHNYSLLKHLKTLAILEKPILVGMSRKRMIQHIAGTDAENSLNGTTAVNMLALINGATILRVHDVSEAMQTIKLYLQYVATS